MRFRVRSHNLRSWRCCCFHLRFQSRCYSALLRCPSCLRFLTNRWPHMCSHLGSSASYSCSCLLDHSWGRFLLFFNHILESYIFTNRSCIGFRTFDTALFYSSWELLFRTSSCILFCSGGCSSFSFQHPVISEITLIIRFEEQVAK